MGLVAVAPGEVYSERHLGAGRESSGITAIADTQLLFLSAAAVGAQTREKGRGDVCADFVLIRLGGEGGGHRVKRRAGRDVQAIVGSRMQPQRSGEVVR